MQRTTETPQCPADASETLSLEDSTSVIGGGCKNSVMGDHSSMFGGLKNTIYEACYATLSSGYSNEVVSKWATITGGFKGRTSGRFSVVTGGSRNTAAGKWSLALGKTAKVQSDGSASFCFDGDVCNAESTKIFRIEAQMVILNNRSLANWLPQIKNIRNRDRALAEEPSIDQNFFNNPSSRYLSSRSDWAETVITGLTETITEQAKYITLLQKVAEQNGKLRKRIGKLKLKLLPIY
jgi:hypothetical protein